MSACCKFGIYNYTWFKASRIHIISLHLSFINPHRKEQELIRTVSEHWRLDVWYLEEHHGTRTRWEMTFKGGECLELGCRGMDGTPQCWLLLQLRKPVGVRGGNPLTFLAFFKKPWIECSLSHAWEISSKQLELLHMWLGHVHTVNSVLNMLTHECISFF